MDDPSEQEAWLHLEGHPKILQALANKKAAAAGVALQKRLRWPIIDLELGILEFSPGSPVNDAHVALSFELPFFHVHGPLISRSRAQEAQADTELKAWKLRLLSGAKGASRASKAASVRARFQREQIVPSASAAAALANEGYQAGSFDINSVLLAEQSLADARLDAARSEADRVRAWALVQHALGVGP